MIAEFVIWMQGNTAMTIAGAFYLALVLLELFAGYRKQVPLYEKKDTVINLGLGAITSVAKFLMKGATLLLFYFVFNNFAPWHIPIDSIAGFIALFFLCDLTFYWYHRMSHRSRFFWATHVAHHSSRIFNVSTALRGNFIHFFYRFLFWAPLAWLGFEPILIVLIDELNFYYQMWIHTRAIDRMPRWFEFFFNTPSHHRVHHGSNEKYLDKNYGAVFIIWDRMFGTFETEKEHVVYGITHDLEEQTMTNVITHEFRDMWKDVKNARNLKEAWNYMFAYPGWKPEEQEAPARSSIRFHGEKEMVA
ncbi:MAG TPA: sterol desaturase family protein [Phnomibacter sp.]|nr:sterol desaturase family protein [Phnomibacter sp.]